MNFVSRLLAVMLLPLIPLTALPQWSTSAAVNNAICTLSGEQAIPKVAVCPNGDTYIGYFSNESGNYNVRLQRLDMAGNTMWAADGILVSGHPQETWLTDWDMCADPANHAILVFNDIRTGNTNVVAYRISPAGTFVWGADGILLSNNSAFNAAPDVTATQAGNIVAAWSSDDVSRMQKLDPSGNLQWGPAGITISTANRVTWPQLLAVGDDDVILKYFNDSGLPNAPTRHVYAQRYGASGTAVWSAPAVVSNAGGISAWTQIFPFVNDGSDGFFMTWHDDRDNNQRASTFVQHVSSTGAVLFPANGVEVSNLSNMNHYYPTLALPPGSTDVYVFWNEMNTLQSQWGIFGQKIDASGTVQWGPSGMAFIPVSGTNVLPYAARATASDVILVYEQYTNAVDGHIKAMRVSPTGAFLWSPAQKDICTVTSQKVHAEVSEFDDGQLIVTWEDDRNGNADIYAQNLGLDGNPGPVLLGFIQGNVTITGEPVDVMQATVSTGGYSTHPDFTGHYSMQVPEGTYTVTATHPYTTTQTTGGVQVTGGIPTTGVNFSLTVNRADLVVDAVTNWGITMNMVVVDIQGPEGTLSGTIVNDSLVFPHVLYGNYSGTAILSGTPVTAQADTVIDAQNHRLRFIFVLAGLPDRETGSGIAVNPLPAVPGSTIDLQAASPGTWSFVLWDACGRSAARTSVAAQTGPNRFPLTGLTGAGTLPAGVYFLRATGPKGETAACKLMVAGW